MVDDPSIGNALVVLGKPKDFPIRDVLEKANQKIKEGWTVHQKFTCAGCGERLTVEKPNVFYATGTCDKCPVVTNIETQGCNYMAKRSFETPKNAEEALRELK